MMLRYLLFFPLLLLPFLSRAGDTVFTAKGGRIKDAGTGSLFNIKVGKLKKSTMTYTYGIEYVSVTIKSKSNNKLNISLVGPDATTTVTLANASGGTGKNFDSTIFIDSAHRGITSGLSPFTGYYRPIQSLKAFNAGLTSTGTWQLNIKDAYGNLSKDTLVSWSIKFSSHPSVGVRLDSSNLPILIINTKGKTIPGSDPALGCYVYMIDNGPGIWNYKKDSMKFKTYAGFKLHGNSSRGVPKLSYAMEMRDSKGNVHDTSIFGMPKEHDWDLIANDYDYSVMHNAMAQHIFQSMGHYSPRSRIVEVILDGSYFGVYQVMEKVKQGKSRLPIAKLPSTVTSGDSLTGGYIIKCDWNGNGGWTSKYTSPSGGAQVYQYDYPWPVNTAQKNYIHKYYDSLEAAMYGAKQSSSPGNWRKYGDEKSIMDYMLLLEISDNGDTYYGGSFFTYKERNSDGGLIHLGPAWDYDLSFGTWGGISGWLYQTTAVSFWWAKLFGTTGYGKGDTLWKNNLKCRWTQYRRGILNINSIGHFLDSCVTLSGDAAERNFFQWPHITTSYKYQVDTFKGWMNARMKWLDKNMPGTCKLDIDAPVVKLNWKDTVLLEVNNSYIDSGITYHDNYGDTNVKIVKGSNLDTSIVGTYVISYFLSDKAGNKSSIERVVKVIDTIAPQIVFLKGDTVNTEVLEAYVDKDVQIKDNYDTSFVVSKSGTFNFLNNIPDTLGYFTRLYKVSDHSGNADSAMHIIHVVDTHAPVITFKSDTVKLEVYDTYSDTDVHIKDNFDKAPVLSNHGNLKSYKTDSVGMFVLWYKGTDASGNSDSMFRIINVVDEIAPSISLVGADSVFLSTLDSVKYLDSGYLARDNYDKHPKVDTISNFNGTQMAGTFNITYTARDQSNNKSASVSRIITVSQGSGIENQDFLSRDIHVYPNPGSGLFRISTKLPANAKALLSVYDEMGREMPSFAREISGEWSGTLNLSNESEGIYTVKLQTGKSIIMKKLILLK